MINKVVIMVLDSLGIGALPDAAEYGDEGSHTLANIINKLGGLNIPNLVNMGLGNIKEINIPYHTSNPIASFGKAAEVSPGKDTTTGHWEIAGLQLESPFPVYPNGFPDEVMVPFVKKTGLNYLWNKPASGSEIIKQLGIEHMKTSKLIVYTSADSVFQIAAHEQVIPLEKLYNYCEIARDILQGKHAVGRVIARPFIGQGPEDFTRTKNRKDFSLAPSGTTILDILVDNNFQTIGVGKIGDIFAYKGLTRTIKTNNNEQGIDVTIGLLREDFSGLIFTNLVDFDMLYGHRNDVKGYARAIEDFDKRLPELINSLGSNDILILTSDHGCDPTTISTDHSREYIPILVYGSSVKRGIDLGIRSTFSDIGATVLDLFGIGPLVKGRSFVDMIYERSN